MTAKTGRFPALQTALLVLALLMALIPSGTALADLTVEETEAASVEETSTESVATEVVEEPAPEPAPPAEGAADSDSAQSTESAPVETQATPAAAPTVTKDGSANTAGPYDPNGVGEPSGNGNGGNDNSNKPCAGCVGNADDKNPPGQAPGPDEDGDNGYECDGNSGAGKTNPAHSGCQQAVEDPDPSIGLVKTGPSRSKVGRTITYHFAVRNTGDTTLSDVHITDPLIGGGEITVSPATLPVGGSGQASAQYTIRAQDVNASDEVPNTATVKGTDPDGEVVTAQDSHVVKVPPVVIVVPKRHTICHATGKPTKYVVITPSVKGVYNGHLGFSHHGARDIIPPFMYDANGDGVEESYSQNWDAAGQTIFNAGCKVPDVLQPDIDLEKTGPARADLGQTIEYRFKVTNTGDTELRNVHVTDPLLGGETIAVDPPTLAANGGEGFATAEYTIESVDLITKDPLPPGADLGDRYLPNTATAHGTAPDDTQVEASDDHEVVVPAPPVDPDPEIDLEKGGPARSRLGRTITYTFDVTNTGNTTLSNVHVTDPLLGGEPIPVDPPTLAAKARGTATARYTIESADLITKNPLPPGADLGDRFLPNTATAHGTAPDLREVQASDDHEVVVPAPKAPPKNSIRLEKDGPRSAIVGERITYTFTVTNTGEETLTNVRVRDPLVSDRMLTVTPSTLAPQGVGTATATYQVTKADRDAGVVLNTAVGRGTPPSGPDVTDRDDHDVLVPPRPGPRPRIELDKSGPATARVGDTITYRFRATNTGRTILTNVHITDRRLDIENLAVTPSTLAPGESGTASATYTVTRADKAAGRILNTAIVTGQPPTGVPVTDEDTHTTLVPGGPPPPERPDLPATGTDAPTQLLLAALALLMGAGLLLMARRTTPQFEAWTTGTMPARRLSGSDTPPPVHRRLGGGAVGPAT